MFGIEKKELLKNLENLRKLVCCYAGPTCDCKYGIKYVERPTHEDFKDNPGEASIKMRKHFDQSAIMRGEQTGCPELRQAISLIHAIPNKEFKKWNSEARITIPDSEFEKALNEGLKRSSMAKDMAKDGYYSFETWSKVFSGKMDEHDFYNWCEDNGYNVRHVYGVAYFQIPK